jgi:valyl-tRNA synthetase
VHLAPWPTSLDGGDASALDLASAAIAVVRKAKSTAKLSMRAVVAVVEVSADSATLALVRGFADDLVATGRIGELRYREVEGGALEVAVQL